MKTFQDYGPFLGRLLLALIFVLSGVNKIQDFDGTQEYMAAHGMSMTATLLIAAIAIEILAGLSVLLGLATRWSALLLAAYLIPVTLVFHAFWAVDAAQQQIQMVHFLKNLAIMGGLVSVSAQTHAVRIRTRQRRAFSKHAEGH